MAAADRDDEAIEQYHKLIKLEPFFGPALWCLAIAYAFRGEFDLALPHAGTVHAISPSVPQNNGLLAALLERLGHARRAKELVNRLQPADAYGVPRGLAY